MARWPLAGITNDSDDPATLRWCSDTPYFAATGKSGHVTLSNLGAGKYTVTVWHPDLHADAASVPVTLSGSARSTMKFSLR